MMAGRWTMCAVVLGMAACWCAAPLAASAQQINDAAPTQVNVTVQASAPLAKMPQTGIGVAVAVWDGYAMDSVIPGLIRSDGFKVIRYPGGSYADIYHWKTRSATSGMQATIRPGTGFDHFMALVQKAGATPLITVNYGTNAAGTGGGDPAEASAWVRYANREKHYQVKYWEIGNEIYGNGFYNGHGWEADLHAPADAVRLQNPLLGPDAYGKNVNAYITAMKAADSTVQIGAVLTTPGNWPDGVTPNWNAGVLKQCGSRIDFVVVHWYPNGRTVESLLKAPTAIPQMLSGLKSEIAAYCGANASHVKIWMTEGDASGWDTRPPGALYAADELATWLEGGAAHVDWWDLHNGAHTTRDGYYDDQGILSNASTAGTFTEPAPNTPFPPYYGVQMFSHLAAPGDTFINAASDSPSLVAHAALQQGGKLGILLINESATTPAQVTIRVTGVHLSGPGTFYEYGPQSTGIARSAVAHVGPAITATVPPYSLVVITDSSHGR